MSSYAQCLARLPQTTSSSSSSDPAMARRQHGREQRGSLHAGAGAMYSITGAGVTYRARASALYDMAGVGAMYSITGTGVTYIAGAGATCDMVGASARWQYVHSWGKCIV